MKLFIFILIYSIGLILSSICDAKFFHFGFWYSFVFGVGWCVLLKVAYGYTKQRDSLPDMKINWFRGEVPTSSTFFFGVDPVNPHEERKIEKKSFIKK